MSEWSPLPIPCFWRQHETDFCRLTLYQGVHIPTKAEIAPEKAAEPQKKKIVYVDKKKLAKKQQQQAQQQNESHESTPVAEDVVSEAVSKEATPTEGETIGQLKVIIRVIFYEAYRTFGLTDGQTKTMTNLNTWNTLDYPARSS